MNIRLLATILAASVFAAAGCCKSNSDSGGTTTTTTTPTINAPLAAAGERFEGTYSSNWGNTTFTASGDTVLARYPRGSMTCTAVGDVLNCDWVEGIDRGKALLTRQSNGNISGTWGKGTSATNGGPWVFTKL